MTRKRIQFIASVLISIFFLYLAFRNVPLRDLWEALSGVRYLWVVPFIGITLVSMYFRTIRWKYLLEPVVQAPSYRFFPPLIICFALNGMLPGRAGEFARAYLVARDHRVKFSSSLATVFVERIADGIGLLALFIAILAFVPINEEIQEQWGKWVIDANMLRAASHQLLIVCVVLLGGTILMLWRPFRRLVQAVIDRTPLAPRGLKDALNRFIDAFAQGLLSLRSPRIIFWVIVHTATVWLTVGWSLLIMSYGFPGMEMSFMQGMATSIIICVAILIPAAPGYWGLYEVGCILALVVLGVVDHGPEGRAMALSYSLVAHFFQICATVVPGLWFMWRRRMGLRELTRAEETQAS
ncbi:hypothetical protein AMJ85_00485 [candidate division BRC1 bacterium SM23_51]|nr:MAG: hypothetical protein AMJ85_00485 [candidate division BRC1 bacterium SM23_51]